MYLRLLSSQRLLTRNHEPFICKCLVRLGQVWARADLATWVRRSQGVPGFFRFPLPSGVMSMEISSFSLSFRRKLRLSTGK